MKMFRARLLNLGRLSSTLFRLSLFLVLGIFLVLNARPVFANQSDIDAIYNGTTFYDPSSEGNVSSCSTSNNTTGSVGGVYFLGDSIGTQVSDGLKAAIPNRNFQANVKAGRNLSGSTRTAPDGLSSVDTDQPYIKTADTIVVELGTNSAGFTAENVGQLLSKIREQSPTAAIYWVDTAVVHRQDLAKTLDNVNSIIYSQSTALNFKVISWNKKVFGNSADPQNINPDAPDNGYIRRSDEYVHLTDPAGVNAMTTLITTAISGSGGTSTASGCACTQLSGNDVTQKIWNYFIGKGLSPVVTAGIMGNLQAESHFESRLVQYGGKNSRGEISVQGQPSSLDDTMLIDGTTGYGIAQWTSTGRQQGLHNLAVSRGVQDSDLTTQLDWLWQELTTSYASSVYDQIKDSTDLTTINQIFGHGYEGYGTTTEATRLRFANGWLLKYGSGTDNTSSASSGGSPPC